MGDEDDRLPLFPQVAQDAEQVVRFRRCQHTGRFIEDKDVGLTVKRLEDLDPLLMSDAEVFDRRIRIDVQFVFFGQVLELSARLVQRRAQQGAVLGPENDIFQNGEVLHQFEMLEHHADTGSDRRLAVGDLRFLAVNEDLAAVSLVKPVEDRHQGRLARAVLANDAVDRAGLDADRNVLVGLYWAEGL